MKKNILLLPMSRLARLSVLALTLIGVTGCVETIDDSNAVIKTSLMMSEYLEQTPECSHIKSLFDRVRLGEKTSTSGDSISSITSVLGARGNYTCFAPTNAAVEAYVEELNGTKDLSSLTYEQAKLIAYSCVIDNGEEGAYETPDFSSSGSFAKSNFFDRVLTYRMDSEAGYIINGTSHIIESDIDVENGVIHLVDAVIAPSADNVWELFDAADNMKIMARLFKETGWADKMTDENDKVYEQTNHQEEMKIGELVFKVVQKRLLGFTAFIEPDEVLMNEWGIAKPELDAEGEIANWGTILDQLTQKCAQAYPNATETDLKHQNNALNRFVAYHVIKGRVPHDRFVYHYSEFGYGFGADRYNPQKSVYPTDIWDYYVSGDEYPEMLKVMQVGHNNHTITENKLYLNRICKYDAESYIETEVINEGIEIAEENIVMGEAGDTVQYTNNASNGYYYPINHVLVCDNAMKTLLSSERIRFDYVTMLPEMASNNLRGTGAIANKSAWAFPNGYFENIVKESGETRTTYPKEGFTPHTGGWIDYQGDQYMFGGVYDFTLKLPPVPKSGMYELRMGVSTNSLRGMAQLYFGSDPDQLTPAGLPFDMRLSGEQDTNIPWLDDRNDDRTTQIENDKAMRNAGYMKGPAYWSTASQNGVSDIKDGNIVRNKATGMRRIIATEYLEENTPYYLRIKSALVDTEAQLVVDYFEYVSRNVYNGAEAEDIW